MSGEAYCHSLCRTRISVRLMSDLRIESVAMMAAHLIEDLQLVAISIGQ